MDWLVGDHIQWDTLVMEHYKPVRDRNYTEILSDLHKAGVLWWSSQDSDAAGLKARGQRTLPQRRDLSG